MPSPYDEYFRPIVNKWVELIEAARVAKQPFTDVAEQCMSFYAARNGFIFEKEFRQKYLNITNENELPKHRLTFSKAYEYVSIFGPLLYWDNPQRVVKPRKQVQFSPDVFGITPQMQQQWQEYQQQLQQYQQALAQFQQAQFQQAQYQQAMMAQQGVQAQGGQQPGGLPPGQLPNQGAPPAMQAVPGAAPGGVSAQGQVQGQPPLPPVPQPPQVDPQLMYLMQLWDWSQQVTRQRAVADDIRCRLMEAWLNYTPGEMPFGGLATHSRLAIVEALVKGRGCLWSEPFVFDGSEKRLVGSFFDSVDNLLIDPDATSLSEAKWIAKRIIAPVYQVEEEFSLTPGSLEGKGSHIISGPKVKPIGGTSGGGQADARKDKIGRTAELITYYKIWSKCGVGTKLVGAHVDAEMKENLNRVSGKFAFLCIAPGVNYPLNLPADQLEGMSDDDVRQRLEWPYECWKDDRWPVAVLDFYPHPNRAWPIAPLAPALGELTFLQVVLSHLADRVVKSSRDFIAVLQSAGEDIENKIKNGGDLTVLPLTEVHNDIGKVVQFLQQPSVNRDAWLIVDRVNQLFERRTGLTELMAGQTGTQSRSAADAQIKGNQINVRPEDMQRRVEEWQTEAAKLEKIATRRFIESSDVELLFGPVGAYLWQMYITNTDPELVIRETDCTIEAGSVRKPNKERDVQNVNSVAQFLGPLLNQIYMQMGNPAPMSWLLHKMADVYDWDTNGLELPAPQPPQPDGTQQQMQQMEMARQQLEMQGAQQKQAHEGQMLQAKGAMDAQKFQLEMAKLAGQLQLQQAEIEAKKLQAQADAQQAIIEQEYGRRDAESDMLRSQAKLAGDAAQIELAQRRAETELQVQQAKAAQELQARELKTQMELAQQARKAKQQTQLQLFGEDPVAKLFSTNRT